MSGTARQQFFNSRELVAAQSMTVHWGAFQKAPHKSEICRFANPFSRENLFTYYDRATLLDLIEDTP